MDSQRRPWNMATALQGPKPITAQDRRSCLRYPRGYVLRGLRPSREHADGTLAGVNTAAQGRWRRAARDFWRWGRPAGPLDLGWGWLTLRIRGYRTGVGGKDMARLFRRVWHAGVTGIRHARSAVWGRRRSPAGEQGASAGETGSDLAVQRTGEAVLAEAAELAEIEHKVIAEHQGTAEKAKTVPRPRQPPPAGYH